MSWIETQILDGDINFEELLLPAGNKGIRNNYSACMPLDFEFSKLKFQISKFKFQISKLNAVFSSYNRTYLAHIEVATLTSLPALPS